MPVKIQIRLLALARLASDSDFREYLGGYKTEHVCRSTATSMFAAYFRRDTPFQSCAESVGYQRMQKLKNHLNSLLWSIYVIKNTPRSNFRVSSQHHTCSIAHCAKEVEQVS